MAKSTGAAEYTDCIFAEGKTPLNECPDFDTKPSQSSRLRL